MVDARPVNGMRAEPFDELQDGACRSVTLWP
jgi:hypothetical protein